ncbi:MAG TPA: CsbD family protein [Candidatus Dormibacteraeota bacterium]|nr:CsbD family protein [Candidatus Dormibacteraeota bacterium]
MGGLHDEIEGRAKEAQGKLTRDRSREAEGKGEKVKGQLEQDASDVKDAIEDAFNNGEGREER